MTRGDLFALLSEAFKAERALKHVEAIHQSDRWFDFAHFRGTAQYCADGFRTAGLDEVEMLRLSADGKTRYGDWVLPRAWDVEGATLRFEGEAGEAPLADYLADPCSLMMFSAPTAPGGIAAEVVDIDDPAAPRGSLRGKLLLMAGRPAAHVELAKAQGAAGVISDFFPLYPGVRGTAGDMRGHSRWENDFIYPVNDAGLAGFSLSPENGRRLRLALAAARAAGRALVLRAEVRTRFYDGDNFTVSALIPGSEAGGREFLFCAHLYEPGANDNASGCGALLELAASLNALIRSGRLCRPRFGLRFVLGYECAGLMGYFAHHGENVARTAMALNMDMVGAAAADRAILHIWHNPLSNWSCMDSLLPALAREYREHTGDSFAFTETPFSVGDNLLADPAIGVPTVSMIMHPARSYHSSMDGPELVDGAVLKRNAVIAAGAALTVALPMGEGLAWLAQEMERHRQAMLAEASGLKRAMLAEAFRHARAELMELMGQEWQEPGNGLAGVAAGAEGIPAELAGKIPVRTRPGTLTLAGLEGWPREALPFYPFYDYGLNCPLFWADGRRSLADVTALSAAEQGERGGEAYGSKLAEYFLFLEKLGYIRLLD